MDPVSVEISADACASLVGLSVLAPVVVDVAGVDVTVGVEHRHYVDLHVVHNLGDVWISSIATDEGISCVDERMACNPLTTMLKSIPEDSREDGTIAVMDDDGPDGLALIGETNVVHAGDEVGEVCNEAVEVVNDLIIVAIGLEELVSALLVVDVWMGFLQRSISVKDCLEIIHNDLHLLEDLGG